jgi:hypothetical protein
MEAEDKPEWLAMMLSRAAEQAAPVPTTAPTMAGLVQSADCL